MQATDDSALLRQYAENHSDEAFAALAALAKSVTAAALAQGATASGSTLTVVKGALKLMAWTKAKTAAVVCVATLFAAGTTTVVIKKIVFPSVDESLWSVNSDNFAKAPPVLIIRPTHFPNRAGLVQLGGKVIGQNMAVSSLLTRAYDFPFGADRMILPPEARRKRYDLMLTLPSHESEALREKMKKQLGLAGRRETRETNVLLLKARYPAMLESQTSKGGSPAGYMTSDISFRSAVITNQPISVLANLLDGLLQSPTVDQTGLTNNFDLNLKWNRDDPQHEGLKQALLDQLGLELAPGVAPIEMLVVEKVK